MKSIPKLGAENRLAHYQTSCVFILQDLSSYISVVKENGNGICQTLNKSKRFTLVVLIPNKGKNEIFLFSHFFLVSQNIFRNTFQPLQKPLKAPQRRAKI